MATALGCSTLGTITLRSPSSAAEGDKAGESGEGAEAVMRPCHSWQRETLARKQRAFVPLKIAQHFAAGARAEALPSLQVDTVGDKANGAVAEQEVDAAGVVAAGGTP